MFQQSGFVRCQTYRAADKPNARGNFDVAEPARFLEPPFLEKLGGVNKSNGNLTSRICGGPPSQVYSGRAMADLALGYLLPDKP